MHFLLAANAGEVMVFVVAISTRAAGPSDPSFEILLVNLLTDGLPAVALAVDPPERDAMRRPPRPPAQGILDPIRARLVVGGLATGLAAFAAFLIGDARSHSAGQTMAVHDARLRSARYVFSVRGTGDWFFRAGRNVALLGAVLLSAALRSALVLSIPTAAGWFDVAALSPAELASALALAAVPFLCAELYKARARSGRRVDGVAPSGTASTD